MNLEVVIKAPISIKGILISSSSVKKIGCADDLAITATLGSHEHDLEEIAHEAKNRGLEIN